MLILYCNMLIEYTYSIDFLLQGRKCPSNISFETHILYCIREVLNNFSCILHTPSKEDAVALICAHQEHPSFLSLSRIPFHHW